LQSPSFWYRLFKELYNVKIQWQEVDINKDLVHGKIRLLGSMHEDPCPEVVRKSNIKNIIVSYEKRKNAHLKKQI